MINLKVNFSNLVKQLIISFILFFSVNVFSEENKILELIEKNWNETQTISGRFFQILDNDKTISGNFYIEKPYKSSFTYDNKLENIITSKFFINIVDQERYLIDKYPIINQPIYKLMSEKISFREIFKILSINQVNDEIVIKLLSKNDSSNIGTQINLTFSNSNYSLKNWEIIDGLGQSTYLEFTKVRKNISIEPVLFVVKVR